MRKTKLCSLVIKICFCHWNFVHSCKYCSAIYKLTKKGENFLLSSKSSGNICQSISTKQMRKGRERMWHKCYKSGISAWYSGKYCKVYSASKNCHKFCLICQALIHTTNVAIFATFLVLMKVTSLCRHFAINFADVKNIHQLNCNICHIGGHSAQR